MCAMMGASRKRERSNAHAAARPSTSTGANAIAGWTIAKTRALATAARAGPIDRLEPAIEDRAKDELFEERGGEDRQKRDPTEHVGLPIGRREGDHLVAKAAQEV